MLRLLVVSAEELRRSSKYHSVYEMYNKKIIFKVGSTNIQFD